MPIEVKEFDLSNLASSALDFSSTLITNKSNENLMREAWEREDTAVQRRKADLIAAGMNPVLAAGQAASTMGPIRLEPPRVGDLPNKMIASKIAANQVGITAADLQRAQSEAEIKHNEAILARAKTRALTQSSDLLPQVMRGMTLVEAQALSETIKAGESAFLTGTNKEAALFALEQARKYGDATALVDLVTKGLGGLGVIGRMLPKGK